MMILLLLHEVWISYTFNKDSSKKLDSELLIAYQRRLKGKYRSQSTEKG